MSPPPNSFSPCQETALDTLTQNRSNVFLTGRAGSGKSFLVRYFLKNKDRKTFPIVASTGAAAVIVGGRTFHSFFGLGIMEGGVEEAIKRALEEKRVIKRLQKIEGFILDEISMIPGPALRAAETICRTVRKKNLPWGGVRVIAVGDFAQLPPVSRHSPTKEWAFLEGTWDRSSFIPLVLKTMMRSRDQDYMDVLNDIRDGVVSERARGYLNKRVLPESEWDKASDVPHLFPRREMADKFNEKRLQEIKKPLMEFPTSYSGDPRSIEVMKRNAPIPEVLKVKESALVMIRVNDPLFKYVNGSLGHVVKVKGNTWRFD